MARKIISRLFGGLGNQLFIYAASRSFALRYNADLYLDTISGFIDDGLYGRQFALGNFTAIFKLASAAQRLEPFSKIRRRIARRISGVLSPNVNGYVFDYSTEFRPDLLRLPNWKTVYLEGYWQSPLYFSETALRNDLKIIPPGDQRNLDMAARIKLSPSTSIHMRFFDRDDQETSQLKERYYSKATETILEHFGPSHFYVFSDDPVRAEQISRRMWEENFTIVDINNSNCCAYADMWLMSLCDCNIIADSTFSWWGAWFNCSPKRIVIAPRQSLSGRNAAWNIESLIPNGWISL